MRVVVAILYSTVSRIIIAHFYKIGYILHKFTVDREKWDMYNEG